MPAELIFYIAVFLGAVILYIPAFLALRAFKFNYVMSIAAAPIISLFAACVLGIIYAKMDVWTTGWLLAVSLLIMGTACWIVRFIVTKVSGAPSPNKPGTPSSTNYDPCAPSPIAEWLKQNGFTLLLAILYVALGILMTQYVFAGSLQSFDSTTITYDDRTHLSIIRSFVDRGNFSSIDVNTEYAIGGTGSYYPSAWHVVAAMLESITGVTNLMAANAAIYICCAFIYPLSAFCLCAQVFQNNKRLQFIGAFFPLVFAAFPWKFLIYGRLVSNLLGFALVFVVVVFAMQMFSVGTSKASRIRAAIMVLLSCILSVFTQPNAVFTVIAFTALFAMYQIWQLRAKDTDMLLPRKKRIKLEIIFAFALMIFLALCYQSPFMWAVTHFKWQALTDIPHAALNVVMQGTSFEACSPIAAALVAVGFVAACINPKLRWLAGTFLAVSIIYIVAAGTDIRLKNYLAGFWYTDQYRVSAMVGMISYPLIVYGVGQICRLFDFLKQKSAQTICSAALSLVLVCAIVLVGVPVSGSSNVDNMSQIAQIKKRISDFYSITKAEEGNIISADEQAFLNEAAAITGDARVFNIPLDGSTFAYPMSGMQVLNRQGSDGLSGNWAYRVLQRDLYRWTTSDTVKRALEEVKPEYVLMLDYGHEPFHFMWGDYNPANWSGVTRITPETPGFELVLHEGDMYLYRILDSEVSVN